MTAKLKTLLLIGFATIVPIGVLGGYFALREALAPPDASLVRREGLAGIYLVEQGGQKFLVNSMGGIQKLDTPPPKLQPASTPVVAVNPLDSEEDAPAKALPTPPPSSYAATVLAQYKRSLLESKQFAESTVSYDQGEEENQKRSSFVHDKQTTLDPSAESSPGQGEAPIPTPTSTPTPGETAITPPLPGATPQLQLHPSPLKPNSSVVKTQAEWAGQLAAENVINPYSSVLLVKPPAKEGDTVKQSTGPPDTSPVLKWHVVNNAPDASDDSADQTRTFLNPSPTPSPDDLVPSASPSPSPSPSKRVKPVVSDHPAKIRKKQDDDTDGNSGEGTTFWQRLFKRSGTKTGDKAY